MVKVRPLEPRDFVQVLPLLLEMKHVFDEGETLEARFADFCSSKAHGLLGAELEGQLIGYASLQDYGQHLRSGNQHRIVRLHDLFVLEQCRRQGVGRLLLEGILVWCRARPIRFLEWQAGAEAVPFYERLGYKGEACPQPDYPSFEVDFALEVKAQG